MKKLLTPLLAMMLVGCQQASTTEINVDVTEDMDTATSIEVVPAPETQSKIKWTCPSCNENENHVLRELQVTAKIIDRNALSTIMGNIKSESNFHPNICEGGARVNYNQCHSGGFGLIQWTTVGRYKNLGFFASKYGCNPSTIECQTRFLINEVHFQKVLPEFQNEGYAIHQYMAPAFYWLGWGIKGDRESFSHQYHAKLVQA